MRLKMLCSPSPKKVPVLYAPAKPLGVLTKVPIDEPYIEHPGGAPRADTSICGHAHRRKKHACKVRRCHQLNA